MELTLNVVADVVMDDNALDKMLAQMSAEDMETLAMVLTIKAREKRNQEYAALH